MILLRAAAVLGAVAVLTGCTAAGAPDPSASASAQIAGCAAAADQIVSAVDELVSDYEAPVTTPSPGATPEAAPAPSPDPTSDPLADAVAAARETRDRLGCDPDDFVDHLTTGLDAIEPEGAIATAVWRRASASLLGTVRQDAGEWAIEAGEDLHDVVARAAEGTTVVLPEGTIELDETLVLLQGITLRGAGRDATTIRSSAADAAVIVATAGLVGLQQLTLEISGERPASGLVAGPSASVVLTGVRIAGAVAAADGVGGAGVYLSAEGEEGSGRGTTLEITDSAFEHNAWAGVAVGGGHRVSIRSATFSGNGDVGVLFLDTASGSVTDSTFTGNGIGLAATGTAAPTWHGNTIDGGAVGAQMDADSAPVIDGIHITGATSAGVIYGGRSGGSITGAVCDGVPYGIIVADTAAPTLGENGCQLARAPS